jgi:pantoate--beta-alanine ligase
MQKIETVSEIRSFTHGIKSQGKTIALVATQGALHAGQEALIRAAVEKADVVVVSIFVNPLQFGRNEVTSSYPRSLEADLELCERSGAHAVFAPTTEEIYPRGYSTFVTEEAVSKPLDGVSRPAHFRGVTTVMAQLFNLVRPDYAFFGEKAVQRAAVVRKMITDLHLPIEVLVVPTVREPDGLAAGVRNREFTASQRQEALSIYAAIQRLKEMVASGVRSPDRLIAEATHVLGQRRRVRVIYIAIVDPATMETAREIVPGRVMLVIAAWIDEIRLTDNAIL